MHVWTIASIRAVIGGGIFVLRTDDNAASFQAVTAESAITGLAASARIEMISRGFWPLFRAYLIIRDPPREERGRTQETFGESIGRLNNSKGPALRNWAVA